MKAMFNKEINYTINGSTNAQKCGLFDEFYSMVGPKSREALTTLSVDEKGGLNLLCFMPYINNAEINNFLSSPLHIYRYELPNGIIANLIRGTVSCDFVHLPYSSPIDLREITPKNQLVNAFLVDTATDKIMGIRMLELPESTVRQLLSDWISIEDGGFDKRDIQDTLNRYIFTYSPEALEKKATYVGKNISSITTRNFNTFPM